MLQTVREALEKGCCLEIYYDGLCIIGEVHAVGWDKAHNAAVLLFEKFDTACEHAGEWRFVSLENARDLDVSGYFSEGPRPGYQRSDERSNGLLARYDGAQSSLAHLAAWFP